MSVSIIVAMSENGVIGKDQKLPWHLKEDLQHFKKLTTNHPIIMGRKTYESIGRPLPNRSNLILSRTQPNPIPKETKWYSNPKDLDPIIEKQECFIIGGAEIYKLFFDRTTKIYLTLIHKTIDGDTFFPCIDFEKQFKVTHQEPHTSETNIPFSFITAVRC